MKLQKYRLDDFNAISFYKCLIFYVIIQYNFNVIFPIYLQ